MNGTKPSDRWRTRGTIRTLPSPSPQPSPSGRGSAGFGLSLKVARGMILPDWMSVSLPTNLGVAASRQSAAILEDGSVRRSIETPLRFRGSRRESVGGILSRNFGDYTAEVRVVTSRDVQVVWSKHDGKPVKSVPAEVKRDHADDLKQMHRLVKSIEKMLTAQRIRIERLLMTERAWDLESWRQRYLDQPLLAGITRRLIWHFRHGDRTALGAWLDGKLVDVHGEPLDWLAPETRVRLWHPIGFPVETVSAWRRWLEEHGFSQPFKQAHREVHLLPKLKIAGQCSIEDKFLVVKGSLRTYKIHLGSGNILMKPNDQYLCIVPKQSAADEGRVLLPFEGDHTLSVILSKAFLLAEDSRIKDPSIVRQIKS